MTTSLRCRRPADHASTGTGALPGSVGTVAASSTESCSMNSRAAFLDVNCAGERVSSRAPTCTPEPHQNCLVWSYLHVDEGDDRGLCQRHGRHALAVDCVREDAHRLHRTLAVVDVRVCAGRNKLGGGVVATRELGWVWTVGGGESAVAGVSQVL